MVKLRTGELIKEYLYLLKNKGDVKMFEVMGRGHLF